MLPVYGPYSVADISSHSELLLYSFPLLRDIRAAQIVILEFSKNGIPGEQTWATNFSDGGSANQPMILQGGVGLSCFQVSALLLVSV